MNIDSIKKLISTQDYEVAINRITELLSESNKQYSLLNLLGIALNGLGKINEAFKAFDNAIRLSPDKSAAYINKAILLQNTQKYDEAIAHFRKAVDLEKNNSSVHFNLALALETSGKLTEAVLEYEESIRLNPDNHNAYANLGLLYLLTGNYTKGWEYYEHRFYTGELKRSELNGKRWNGNIEKDKILYVYADQGFGDVIQFSRFLNSARKRVGELVFECQSELYPLMKSIDGIDKLVITRDDFSPQTEYDLQIPLMSIPLALKINSNNIIDDAPYFKISENKLLLWKNFYSQFSGNKIGIVWRGNPVFRKNKIRSTELKYFTQLRKENNQMFSLQKGATNEEHQLMRKYGIIDVSEKLEDFEDTAAALSQLDLLISTDTSVPHLAGAMNINTWLLLSKIPDWRWGLEGDSTPWYSSMKIYRQPDFGNWEKVFESVENDLKYFIKE